MRTALDPDTFTQAFARNGRALWVIASAWVGRAEAEDLVQEVARVAWERRAQFCDGDDPGPWFATIARQLGANWRRRRRPEVRDNEALPEVVASTIAAADWPFDADRAGLSDELAAALSRLPEVARAALLLHVVLGHGFAEIARMLGTNENTAASHARRARLALREALTPARER
ncbi:MAG: RNA polymerase sigma factor [Planctomycetota bacterium]